MQVLIIRTNDVHHHVMQVIRHSDQETARDVRGEILSKRCSNPGGAC